MTILKGVEMCKEQIFGVPMAKNMNRDNTFGKPLKEIDDIPWLRNAVDTLWSIIDDIDTADDRFKENIIGFRKYTMKKQSERHKVLVSDGYDLFLESK